MMITLMCSESPRSLGIVEGSSMINMDKLHSHVDNCKICSQYYNENIFKILNKINSREMESNDHAQLCQI